MVSRARNDRVFIGKRARWIQIWRQILTGSSNRPMVETVHAQWKIAKIDEKQRRTAKLSTSYRKSMLLNPFSVTDLRPEVELMHLLRMCRHYCHVWNRRHWTDSEFAWASFCNSFLSPFQCVEGLQWRWTHHYITSVKQVMFLASVCPFVFQQDYTRTFFKRISLRLLKLWTILLQKEHVQFWCRSYSEWPNATYVPRAYQASRIVQEL